MDHLKEFPASDMQPQIRRAGFWGATVFRALCRMSARHDLGGEIPPHYQDLEHLADILNATEYLDNIREGVEACFDVGLMAREELGGGHGEAWAINGWRALYGEKPKSHLQKREEWRDRKAKLRGKPSESLNRPALSHGTENVPATRPDETRPDQTRQDLKIAGAEAPPPKTQKRPKAEKPPDPRHVPAREAWADRFRHHRGADPPWSGKEAGILDHILRANPTLTVDEFEAAAIRALRSATYPLVSTLAEFSDKLPHFLGTGPPSKAETERDERFERVNGGIIRGGYG